MRIQKFLLLFLSFFSFCSIVVGQDTLYVEMIKAERVFWDEIVIGSNGEIVVKDYARVILIEAKKETSLVIICYQGTHALESIVQHNMWRKDSTSAFTAKPSLNKISIKINIREKTVKVREGIPEAKWLNDLIDFKEKKIKDSAFLDGLVRSVKEKKKN